MDKKEYWRLCDQLSVIQAALLIVGEDPAVNQDYVDDYGPSNRPEGYDAVLSALQDAINTKKLKATLCYRVNSQDYNFLKDTEMEKWEKRNTPNWYSTMIAVEDLRAWLASRGFRTGFFFPEGVETDDFLDPQNACYAPKLAAAINAWKAVSGNEGLLNGKTPKQALLKWLRENAHKYGLTDDDGKPNELGIEEIAKVTNWKPEGGAARTPTAANTNPPTPKKDKKTKDFIEKEEDGDIPF